MGTRRTYTNLQSRIAFLLLAPSGEIFTINWKSDQLAMCNRGTMTGPFLEDMNIGKTQTATSLSRTDPCSFQPYQA